jgi:predicted amidophosphoribosyltransferase
MFLLIPALGLTFLREKSDTRLFEPGFLRIRCPLCGWQPEKKDRWMCWPGGCQHEWNTFETAGVCPACAKQWHSTACLRCQQWSPHEDWYERTSS